MSKGQMLLELWPLLPEYQRVLVLRSVSGATLRAFVKISEREGNEEHLGLAMVEITRRFMAKRSKRKKS